MMNNEKELNIAEKVSLGVTCCCCQLPYTFFYSILFGFWRRKKTSRMVLHRHRSPKRRGTWQQDGNVTIRRCAPYAVHHPRTYIHTYMLLLRGYLFSVENQSCCFVKGNNTQCILFSLLSLWQSGVRIIQLNDCSSRHYGQLSIINNNDDNGTMVVVVAGGWW